MNEKCLPQKEVFLENQEYYRRVRCQTNLNPTKLLPLLVRILLKLLSDPLLLMILNYYNEIKTVTNHYEVVAQQVLMMNQTDECQKNHSGYLVNSTGLCAKCSDSNCHLCQADTCLMCKSMYAIKTDFSTNKSTCQACQSNCEMCYTVSKENLTAKCQQCSNLFQLSTESACVANSTACNPTFFYNNSLQSCSKCLDGCAICSTVSNCTSCDIKKGFVMNATNTSHCIQTMCPQGMFFNASTQMCNNCSEGCEKCKNVTHCDMCSANFTKLTTDMNVTCQRANNTCSVGQFYEPFSSKCQPCLKSCKSCSSLYTCQECASEQFTLTEAGSCLDQCKNNTLYPNMSMYWNMTEKVCAQCPSSCKNCQMNKTDLSLSCDECQPGHQIMNHTNGTRECLKINCTGTRPVFMIRGQTDICEYCSIGCSKCTSRDICDTCSANFAMSTSNLLGPGGINLNYCTQNCSIGHFMNFETFECKPCIQNCSQCNNNMSCMGCDRGFYSEMLNSTEMRSKCTSCPDKCSRCYEQINPNNVTESNTTVTCYHCNENFMVDWNQNSKCVPAPTCSAGQYFDQYMTSCQLCANKGLGCISCTESSGCLGCRPGFNLSTNMTCEYRCNRTGQFYDATTDSCLACSGTETGCLQCSESNSCDVCKQGYAVMYNATTQLGSCVKCQDNCLSCSVWTNKTSNETMPMCKRCDFNFMLNNKTGMCEPFKCPDMQFFDAFSLRCMNCSRDCIICKNRNTCMECITNDNSFTIFNGSCHDTCKLEMMNQTNETRKFLYFDKISKKCMPCSIAGCQRCNMTAEATEVCHQCEYGMEASLDNKKCSAISCEGTGIFHINETACGRCSKGCVECDHEYQCNMCSEDLWLSWEGRCLANCSQNQFYDWMNMKCAGNVVFQFFQCVNQTVTTVVEMVNAFHANKE